MDRFAEPLPRAPESLARRALLVLGALTLLLGTISIHARDALFDSDEVGRLAARAVERPEVRAAIATEVVDQVVAFDPELLVIRPLIESIVDGVLQTNAVSDAIRFGVADLHRTLVLDETVSRLGPRPATHHQPEQLHGAASTGPRTTGTGTMSVSHNVIGIDVSKHHLDIYHRGARRIVNNAAAITSF